nr:Pyridoxal phosphate-dependent decarboxylase domain containing protein [Haemonchus contortus]
MVMELAKDFLAHAHEHITVSLRSVDPLVLTSATMVSTFTLVHLWNMHSDDIGIRRRLLTRFFSVVKRIPWVKAKIEKEIGKVREALHKTIHEHDGGMPFLSQLPADAVEADNLIELIENYSKLEGPRYLEGKVSGAVFNDEKDMEEMRVYGEVFKNFAWSNPLWPKLFPGVRKMEAEVVRMCCALMHADAEGCGTMSTGGTISILLACLAHRNRALKKGILFPEMVIPTSAHAAFTKAAEVFRIRAVRVPVDPVTFKVDLRKMKNAITSRTCMLVGSAPNFPFGTVDDIVGIGLLGLKYDIPVHVDACLGGFILPFMDDTYSFDFRVPGVCSISADTHKYGLSPKGSSVVLYKNKGYLHNQYFCDADWQGGIYASSTLEGSRSGLNIALCWASLLYQGFNKYKQNALAVAAATKKIRDGISSIPELRLQGSSDICIVSWTSDIIDIHRLYDLIGRKGWQLTNLQFPSGIHIMVTLNHTADGVADALIADIRRAVNEIKSSPNTELEEAAALYGMAQKIPDRSIVQEFAYAYLDACYSSPKS